MDRLFLIRHGETDGTAQKRFMGVVELSLNRRGQEDAERLGERLSDERIAAIYYSPAKRAAETALLLAQFSPIPLKKRAALREINFGRWEGLTLEEIYKQDKSLCRKWFDDLENFVMPQGESVGAMKKRVIAAWQEMAHRHSHGTVAIVTHGGPLRILLCHILKLDLTFFWKIRLDTSGLSLITFSRGLPTLIRLNDTGHRESKFV